MSRVELQQEVLPIVKRWRGVLYTAAVVARALTALGGVVLLGRLIALALNGSGHSTGGVGAILVAGLGLLGMGLPLLSVALARADWSGAAALLDRAAGGRPETRLSEPRTLVRPLAYTVVMLTLGGAVAVLSALVGVGSLVALVSPFLVAIGDQAVIGPFTVNTVSQSLFAAVIAVALLAGLVFASPAAARAHASLVFQVLTRPEQRLQRDLSMTAQSRARLVRAFDVERRRIESDLHDGVQPQLLSVSMTLGLALAAMPADAPGRADVARAQSQARQTLEALRRFVRNIHPQVLIDHGLGAAVGELADLFAIPITIDDQLADRLPADVETNLYFCVAELLANVVKHSGASQADVILRRLQPETELVEISVRDDGCGGAGTRRHENGGLDGIADRVAALDGDLVIDSPLGGPTIVTITLGVLEGGRR
ncbi:histidine kinase [Rhodococcus sp. ABRD24]|uniref:sensor histidine kinase n=1 Tax=Rhodococcus sp. ABRD24 TaxID=2507582 RepID=UPI0013F14871|nr:histidine kinase [Rhodococcus sp. ABRD24]